MNYFIYTYIISLLTGRYELNKLTSLPMCGFIAQLVEHRTGIAEVTGSNPVEALIFFRLLLSSCLNWKIHCEDHSSLSSMTAVQIYELFHIYSHHFFLCPPELKRCSSVSSNLYCHQFPFSLLRSNYSHKSNIQFFVNQHYKYYTSQNPAYVQTGFSKSLDLLSFLFCLAGVEPNYRDL